VVGPSDLANGDATTLVPCTGSYGYYTAWWISPGENPSVSLGHEKFCLDAGATLENKGPARVWQCSPGLRQQKCDEFIFHNRFMVVDSEYPYAAGISQTTIVSRSRTGRTGSVLIRLAARDSHRRIRCDVGHLLRWKSAHAADVSSAQQA
jgi:hypothetical protein